MRKSEKTITFVEIFKIDFQEMSTSSPIDAATVQSTPQSGKKRVVEVDTMRGIAIILMVLGHSFLIYPIDFFHQPGYYEFHRWFYTFHMGLLFLVAGAVYSCKDYKSYISKKIHRILVPYIVFDVTSVLFRAFGGMFVHVHADLHRSAVNLLLRGGDYWFLYTIFMIFLIYPWLEKFFNKPWKEAVLVLVLLTINDLHPRNYFLCCYVAKYLPMFIIGKYAMRSIDDFRPTSKMRSLVTILGMALLWWVTNYLYNYKQPLASLCLIRMMSMTVVVFLFACYLKTWAERGSAFSQKTQNLLSVCSKYSLQIYLFDAFWMVLIRTLLINVLHITHPIVILFFMTTINIALTLALCLYVLPKNKWVAWMTGLRSSLK